MGSTPLHLAAREARLSVVKYLVERGANVNVRDNHGNTPLHEAVEGGDIGGDTKVIEYLVEKGA